MARRYDHVVFDLDGTLADTSADLAAATNHVLSSLGRPALPMEQVRSYVGEGARRLIERALAPADERLVEEGLRRLLAYYGDHLLDLTRLYPGIADVIERLVADGVTLSVLTNKPTAMSRAILGGLGVLQRFAAVLGGDAGIARKPDPAGLEQLIRMAEISRERTMMVGDSSIDLVTARAAGTAFCGVRWGFARASLEAHAVPMVDQPAQLLRVVFT